MDNLEMFTQIGSDSDQFCFDVIGVGALNLDYIANASALASGYGSSLTSRISELVMESGAQLQWGTEETVDEHVIYAALEEVNAVSLDAWLGGSAFNAVYALAQMGLGLRLGYVGTAGRVPVQGLSSIQQFEKNAVDTRLVFRDEEHICGVCFSFVEGGERTMLTHAGANSYVADYLEREFDEIVAYLGSSRVVHVTSFLDSRTPPMLLKVLRAVKMHSPDTLISFDPGHVWSSSPTEDIRQIMGLSDYLLANYREFKSLGGGGESSSDEKTAANILRNLESDQATVVVKRSIGVSAFRWDGDEIAKDFYSQIPLDEDEIEDATGAGDVFAAGLLAVVASDRLQIELGSLLGISLARHKLGYVGSHGHSELAGVTRDFIRSLDAERRRQTLPQGVFIAHGHDQQWLAVKFFIEELFDLPVFSFESDVWYSRQVTEALSDYLGRCSFAVCVLTAEDLTDEGHWTARQNVVHELGLFEGKYGSERVMLLIEEGCEFDQGNTLNGIRFPHNGIDRTFWRLRRMLQLKDTTGL
ncbi:MAG: ribokinase [Streptosporangiaceae bacterium]|nr:ribokinase [Streptosporangiaceae bacterium]